MIYYMVVPSGTSIKLHAEVTTMFLDAVVRHKMSKDVIDKEVVEKVSPWLCMKSIPILSPNEFPYALMQFCFNKT